MAGRWGSRRDDLSYRDAREAPWSNADLVALDTVVRAATREAVGTAQCILLVCLDVNGVHNKIDRNQAQRLARKIRGWKPRIQFALVPYQCWDNRWPQSAASQCWWAPVVAECVLCVFPDRRPEKNGTGST